MATKSKIKPLNNVKCPESPVSLRALSDQLIGYVVVEGTFASNEETTFALKCKTLVSADAAPAKSRMMCVSLNTLPDWVSKGGLLKLSIVGGSIKIEPIEKAKTVTYTNPESVAQLLSLLDSPIGVMNTDNGLFVHSKTYPKGTVFLVQENKIWVVPQIPGLEHRAIE